MYDFYTAQSIEPQGWLKKQLEIQAKGLAGNLDKIWPDVRDSAWIGGPCEGWERVPYWLDGFLPLAYLLKDEDMIARGKKYIDAILSRQQESGWLCPCREEDIPTYDTWAVMLTSKVLTVYYECSGDGRVKTALYRMMKDYYRRLSDGSVRLFDWGLHRWYETFFALNFLDKEYHEPWIRELAEILYEQGYRHEAILDAWKEMKKAWTFETHVVNLGMLLKAEAVTARLLPGKLTGQARRYYDLLTEYHGTCVGIFSGDECLAGRDANRGTELCGVVEQMFSLEQLYAQSGDPFWAEQLEKAAFNALPATISDDMWTHQYDQQVNQIACPVFWDKRPFGSNRWEATLFGLEPNYGCCTANMGQGWPKLTLSALMRDGDGIVVALPIPARVTDRGVTAEVETEYPFKNSLKIKVSASRPCRLSVRVPSFAENLTVDGEAKEKTGMLVFDCAAGERTISIAFSTTPKLEADANGLFCVRDGSLIFSLPLETRWVRHEYTSYGVERRFPYCDYELFSDSEWRYGLTKDAFTRCEHPVSNVPFSSLSPAVTMKTSLRRVEWETEPDYGPVAKAAPVSDTPIGPRVPAELVPYGCAKLRMTVMPMTEE